MPHLQIPLYLKLTKTASWTLLWLVKVPLLRRNIFPKQCWGMCGSSGLSSDCSIPDPISNAGFHIYCAWLIFLMTFLPPRFWRYRMPKVLKINQRCFALPTQFLLDSDSCHPLILMDVNCRFHSLPNIGQHDPELLDGFSESLVSSRRVMHSDHVSVNLLQLLERISLKVLVDPYPQKAILQLGGGTP